MSIARGYCYDVDHRKEIIVTRDELDHVKSVLDKIKNPDSNVDLAKSYVLKDIALRERQKKRAHDDQEDAQYYL